MKTVKYEDFGISLTLPEEFEQTKGSFGIVPIGNRGNELYIMMFSYLAMSKEESEKYNELIKQNPEDAARTKLFGATSFMLTLFGISENRDAKDIIKLLKLNTMKEEMFTEVGRAGDIRYFAFSEPSGEQTYLARQEPKFAEEYLRLKDALLETLKQAEYFTPRLPGSEFIGKTLSFETKDIDGNTVKSEDLFSMHEVTMINVWATWCSPCKKELADLGTIHRNLADRDAAVVGFCIDADEEADQCRKLMQENNISYVNLLPYAALQEELPLQSIPVSVFVNREGKIMTYPIIGVPADTFEYEKTIDKLLDKVKEGYDPSHCSTTEKENRNGYLLKVNDTDGAPIEGVRVRFCSDETCMMGTTDAGGKASFAAQQGHYTLHVMKVPEGYILPEEEFAVPETFGEVKIILQKV